MIIVWLVTLLAVNGVNLGVDIVAREVEQRAKQLGAAVIPYWIIVGCYWMFAWEPLRWVWMFYSILLIFMWFSGVREVKREDGIKGLTKKTRYLKARVLEFQHIGPHVLRPLT